MSVYPKPAGIILIKGAPQQGTGRELFGIWPSGFVRMITSSEWELWGQPNADVTIAYGDDEVFNQLMAYDKALRA